MRKLKIMSLLLTVGLMSSIMRAAWGSGTQHGARHESPGEPVEVHITPATATAAKTAAEPGDEVWSESGIDLKDLLAQIYGIDPSRVEFADPALTSQFYDVSMTLPDEESDLVIDARLAAAIKQQFHLAIAVESRPTSVYVVTAPQGAGPGLRPDNAASGTIDSSVMLENTAIGEGQPSRQEIAHIITQRKAETGVALTGITVTAGSVGDFCRTLERAVGKPVVNDTGLTGHYDFTLNGYENRDGMFAMLRQQFGLVVTPELRQVKFLAVRPQ